MAGRQRRDEVYSTAKCRDGDNHDPQLPRGQLWGQTGGERSRAATHDGCKDPKMGGGNVEG